MHNDLTFDLPDSLPAQMSRRTEDERDHTDAQTRNAQLIAQARAGNADSFETLMRMYDRQVLRTATRLLGNSDDARDATQEVFLRMHKYLPRFDAGRDLSPWLYQMTVNVCHDIGRRRHAGMTLSLESETEAGTLPHPMTTHDIEAEIGEAQQRRIISQALLTLPEKERAAIVLRDIEGLETSEVARILGSSEATVRSQISTARLKIKKYRDKILLGKGRK